jgi:hypothetical protein
MSQFIIGVTAGDLPPSVPTSFVGNTGTAIPVGNVLNVIGTAGTTVSASGNTLSVTATGTNIDLVGDVGTAVGPVITQTAQTTAGSSVKFQNSGSTSMLNTTDLNGNTIIGNPAGNLSISGTNNVGLGKNVFTVLTSGSSNVSIGSFEDSALTSGSNNCSIGSSALSKLISGSQNTALGSGALSGLTTGSTNIALGYNSLRSITSGAANIVLGISSGLSYTSSESSNILIGNVGVLGESNVMRLGSTGSSAGQVNTAFIAGVAGVTVSNQVIMTMNSATGQMGTTILNPSGFPWTDVTGATQTIATNNGYITDHANVTYTLPATANIGDTFIIMGKLGITTIAQNANQQILMGSASSTVGVGGSVAGTNVGDCITLVCITAGSSSVYRAQSFVGNFTVT